MDKVALATAVNQALANDRNAIPATRAAADFNTSMQHGADRRSDKLHKIFD